MPEKIIEKFSVSMLQVLNEKGIADKKLIPKLTQSQIQEIYKNMVITRVFDDKSLALQRQGRIGTYASMRGQEAAQIGSAYALKQGDWMFPSFRENGACIMRGMPPESILSFWGGNENGEKIPENINNFTFAIPVCTQVPHAVGAGWAMKIRKEKNASLVYFGDGASSKGDFHEGSNMAGVFQLPVVFVCTNNQYAISLPWTKQTNSKTIAQKAIAYGFEGIRVDGNDVFAMYKATKKALDKARAGKGPTLIEAFTYRMGHHTTADDSTRYRPKKEVTEWENKDPINRLELYMKKNKLLTESTKKKIWLEAKKYIENSVTKMESVPEPKVSEMFDYVYDKLPWNLEEQKKELMK